MKSAARTLLSRAALPSRLTKPVPSSLYQRASCHHFHPVSLSTPLPIRLLHANNYVTLASVHANAALPRLLHRTSDGQPLTVAYARALGNFAQTENNKSTNAAPADASASAATAATATASADTRPRASSMTQEIREHDDQLRDGLASKHDADLIAPADAKVFPRIKTTSLSTKRIVIHDEAALHAVTLVMVAFRSFADGQIRPWRDAFCADVPSVEGRWYDLTVNESFGAQALSGFVQRWQRGRTESAMHDFFLAFNSRAREPLESLMLTTNRMFGNVLLLDRCARVRFRASGKPTKEGIQALLACARKIVEEDKRSAAQSDDADK